MRFTSGYEGVVQKTHDLSGEVGAEGGVEAGVDYVSRRVGAKWIRLHCGRVDPGPTHLAFPLEDNDLVAFTAELTGGD